MTQNETALAQNTQGKVEEARRAVFMPRADIFETKDALVVLADMPGVDESGIDISLEKNELTVRGSVKAPAFENYRLAYEEYAVGDYARSFTIGNDIDRSNISATLKNGVLKLTLPKAQQALARKIVVKGE